MERQQDRGYIACALAVLTTAGCASYQPEPIEPGRILETLDSIDWRARIGRVSLDEGSEALGPIDLATLAVSTNPELVAIRGELGVQRALLVEAGLLPDPEIGWDAMDVLAARIVDRHSSPVEVISGFGLRFPLPRPGERSSRVDGAAWRAEEARLRVLAAEWRLARDVHVAYESVVAAETRLAQYAVLTDIAESTHGYFERARDAGTATGIQENLSLGSVYAVHLDALHADSALRLARQTLNALIGLPPSAQLELRTGEDPSGNEALRASPERLMVLALERRPDLAELMASYQVAESGVRLAVSKQFPRVALGTGIDLTVPVLTRFGRPAIETALARRALVEQRLTSAVHVARAEIAAAHARWQSASRELSLVEAELLPNAEENLELARESLRAGEVTLLEILALQRSLIEARTRHSEARAERSRLAWDLLAACGALLGSAPGDPKTTDSESR